MRILLLLFFFLSGACGLIYEVTWTKLFALSTGGTTYAISTVLAAFMGGLALGSRYGGKFIDRRGDPLLVYGLLEGAIGVYCLAMPFMVENIPGILSPVYNRYYMDAPVLFGLFRFIVSFVILVVPTVLMGASLPVLSRYYARKKENFGWEVGRLFSINTFGAMAGSFSAGFILLPNLGQRLSIYSAAALNITIFVIVLAYWLAKGRKLEYGLVEQQPAEDRPLSERRGDKPGWGRLILYSVLFLYAANGFAGMAYQVAWTRALTLSLGPSAYSFSIIVTVFILGLASGSAVGARWADRLENPAAVAGFLEILIGFSAIGVIWGLGRLPLWIVPVIRNLGDNWHNLLAGEFLVVAALLIAPTFMMGAVFPLVVKAVGMCRGGIGEPVGLVYGWNTFGSIAGSIAAGFFLIPFIGLQNTISVVNVVNWVAGGFVVFVALSTRGVRRWAMAAVPLVLGLVVTFSAPRWDAAIMSSGPALLAKVTIPSEESLRENLDVLFHKDGVDTTVTVTRLKNGVYNLKVNAKADASTHIGDMITQVLSAHIPMTLHRNPRKVCILGLASGVSAGSVLTYPVERLDVMEISRAVVEASRYFDKWNNRPLEDPRTRLILGDGRLHLALTGEKYDVIISEPSNPWLVGESALFTREFYETVRDRLKPGGVFCGWLQGYEIPPIEFRMIMRTFQSVFPNATFWETTPTQDYMMVASTGRLNLDFSVLEKKVNRKKVRKDLRRVGVLDPAMFLSHCLMSPGRFKAAAGEGEYHTDDRLQLEYNTPKYVGKFNSFYPELFKKVVRFKDSDPLFLLEDDPGGLPVEFKKELQSRIKARDTFHFGKFQEFEGKYMQALFTQREAVELSPGNEIFKSSFEYLATRMINALTREKEYAEALSISLQAMKTLPEDPEMHNIVASLYMLMGDVDSAKEQFEKALEFDPDNPQAYYNLGFIEWKTGRREEAAEKFNIAIKSDPDYAPPYNALGTMAAEEHRLIEAEKYYRAALDKNPLYADAYVNLGKILMQHSDENKRKEGKKLVKKALELAPSLGEKENIKNLLGKTGSRGK